MDVREERIQNLKARKPVSTEELYLLNKELFNEYKAYICDSAIHYMNQNLALAKASGDTEKLKESVFLQSYLLSSSALYKEADDVLKLLNRNELTGKEDLAAYYNSYDHLYGELAYYTNDKESSVAYYRISNMYKDSLLMVLDEGSEEYLRLKETIYRDRGDMERTMEINNLRLSRVQPGTRAYAAITFYRSLSYNKLGDQTNRKIYLALSAITDIRLAIKDNASLGLLADILYSEGDIDRAYRYIRFSFDDANFFNARLRGVQISAIQSIINKTYQLKLNQQNDKLRMLLSIISFLLLLLVAAMFYIYRQMQKLAIARNSLQNANDLLNDLNSELSGMNEKLMSINVELSEANHVKEEYIGHFLTLCSTYIEKLENYRKVVYKKIKTGKIEEVLKMTGSSDSMEDELKEFYANFDTTFLHLYPGFVRKFNELLAPEARIVLKKGELLNTELRIYALIRLDISDSARIAEFLRYSVNTIYNYRAKVKNKAIVPRDDFDMYVMKIGSKV